MEPNARASSDVAIVPWAGVVGTEGADEEHAIVHCHPHLPARQLWACVATQHLTLVPRLQKYATAILNLVAVPHNSRLPVRKRPVHSAHG